MKIFVKIRPGARQEKIEKIGENDYVISVKEPPVKGRANKAAVKLLAGYFGLAPSFIKITKGQKSKQKIIEIKKWKKFLIYGKIIMC